MANSYVFWIALLAGCTIGIALVCLALDWFKAKTPEPW
jgi:hypothetical protein